MTTGAKMFVTLRHYTGNGVPLVFVRQSAVGSVQIQIQNVGSAALDAAMEITYVVILRMFAL